MITHDVEVLVIGLGPVGSVLALRLAQMGIAVKAIEGAAVGASDLRASTFHAATLEMLDEVGAARAVIDQGLVAPVYQYRDRATREVFAFDMGELADVTRFPFRIQCEQHKMAHDVARRIGMEENAEVEYNAALLFVEDEGETIAAYVETPTAVERYRARFVIGADGGNSTLRKLLDLQFGGFTYEEKYLCVSTDYPVERHFDDLCYVNYISDPDEWMVLLRVPSVWRVLVPAPGDVSDTVLLSDRYTNGIFARVLRADVAPATTHRTLYRVHQRVVDRFSVGRAILVGDAAHLNSPLGGFGMNSGIHDAFEAADAVHAVLRDQAPLAIVDRYDRRRRTVTNDFIQAETKANAEAMRAGWSAARDARSARMRHLADDPTPRRAFLLRQAMFTSLKEAAAID